MNFRAYCRTDALERGVTGWVRNLPDGTVEAVFEGEREVVERAIEWNRTSQPSAEVTDTHVAWKPWTGEFRTFEIRR